MSTETKRIALDRRVCLVREGRIDIRPERGAILGPLSAMAFVHSVLGACVVIDARKQSVTFQQGVLGLGLGTVELVPFWKIDRLEVQDLPLGEVAPKAPPPLLDLRAWDIVLAKPS